MIALYVFLGLWFLGFLFSLTRVQADGIIGKFLLFLVWPWILIQMNTDV